MSSGEKVLEGLTELIAKTLASVGLEKCHPCSDPDRSDDLIRDATSRVVVLRRIREEFEDEMGRFV